MWFVFSMVTVLAWAGSDLFSKMGTDPNDKYSHWRLVMMVGFVMGIHALITLFATPGLGYSFSSVILYLPVSFLYILSMVLGYVGLRYILLSVSSPICNSSGAVAALLIFLVMGDTMLPIQLLAVALITIGIVSLAFLERKEAHLMDMQSGNKKYKTGVIAILFPILYCILDGVGSFADAYVLENFLSEDQANISYEFTFLAMAIFALIYLTLVKKQKITFQNQKIFGIAALCETAGQYAYVYALADTAIIAAPLISSYSIFSVIFARIFLKEKLTRLQTAAIILVFVGIAILGFEEFPF